MLIHGARSEAFAAAAPGLVSAAAALPPAFTAAPTRAGRDGRGGCFRRFRRPWRESSNRHVVLYGSPLSDLRGRILAMSTIVEIEQAIQRLPPEELARLREWFARFDAAQWDPQFEADAAAGRLDALADEAISDLRQGRCTGL
jgi:hypothetical protein